MSTIQVTRCRPDAQSIGRAFVGMPSISVGENSTEIERVLAEIISSARSSPGLQSYVVRPARSVQQQLYDALASFKIRTATVAMHLDRDWRTKLFAQLDSLLAYDDWDGADLPPTLASFSTFLRMLILLRPNRRPGLGATSDGNLIAAWTVGSDRLTIECLPRDIVRWNLSVAIDRERERAAAETPLTRLAEVLSPYGPERWFANGNQVHSA